MLIAESTYITLAVIMMRSMVRRKIPVTAISSEEVTGLLRKLGLYDDVVDGKVRCYICGRRITLDNIGGVLMIDGKPALVCDKPSCIAKAALLSREKQHANVAGR